MCGKSVLPVSGGWLLYSKIRFIQSMYTKKLIKADILNKIFAQHSGEISLVKIIIPEDIAAQIKRYDSTNKILYLGSVALYGLSNMLKKILAYNSKKKLAEKINSERYKLYKNRFKPKMPPVIIIQRIIREQI